MFRRHIQCSEGNIVINLQPVLNIMGHIPLFILIVDFCDRNTINVYKTTVSYIGLIDYSSFQMSRLEQTWAIISIQSSLETDVGYVITCCLAIYAFYIHLSLSAAMSLA